MPDRILRPLDRGELREVYREHLRADFPAAERKPLGAIESAAAAGSYDTLGLFQGEALLGYAFLWRDGEGECALLDYLAICRGGRGKGLGSELLGMLLDHYRAFPGLLVEAEAEEPSAGEGENALRRRRLDFYRRAGFRNLGYRARLFGVTYDCLGSGRLTAREAIAAHRRHYARALRLPGKLVEIPYPQPKKEKS